MKRRDFWTGFICGATAGVGGALIASNWRNLFGTRVLRLETSLQIAAPVEEVFDIWMDFEELARMSDVVEDVRVTGSRSYWRVNVDGIPAEWTAELTQVIPNQSIAWKSQTGPKHSGRVTFSSLGDDTLVHVQMNYAPKGRVLRSLMAPFAGSLETIIEQALRDFKAALEQRSGESRAFAARSNPAQANWPTESSAHLTGTYGPGPELRSRNQNAKFGEPTVPVEYTRPPESKS